MKIINVEGIGNNVGENNKTGNITINNQVDNSTTLTETLLKYGIEQEDIKELLNLLKMEKPDEKSKQPGAYAQTWISKLLKKAKDGIGNISLNTTATILAQCIMKYYGIVT